MYDKKSKLHIVSVVAVIRNSAGRYLVLKRRNDETAYPGMYTFPGGKIEGNDTVEETLIREVKEETGLQIKPGKFLLKDKSYLRSDGQTSKFFSYLCQVVNDSAPIDFGHDFTDARWVSAAELSLLPHVGLEEEIQKAEVLFDRGLEISVLGTISVKE